MKDRFFIILILLSSFGIAFITTTVLSDFWDRTTGYYTEGINQSKSLNFGD